MGSGIVLESSHSKTRSISVMYKENRRAALPQVTENVYAGRDQTVSINSASTTT
uniref:Uncharacterized protein n=1 Tax=Anguilla anguilla TaxID=7936 RepID=A0A0E9WCM3_ANGAN